MRAELANSAPSLRPSTLDAPFRAPPTVGLPPQLRLCFAQASHCRISSQSSSRCLAIDAPAAEDKLACLSEITQEHGVEWDAAGAAADMLPSVRQLFPWKTSVKAAVADAATPTLSSGCLHYAVLSCHCSNRALQSSPSSLSC